MNASRHLPKRSSALAVPPPTVLSVSPGSGSVAGGTSVTVTGTNFSGASNVRFGANAAMSFTVNSDTRITAIAPPGTGTVQVTVTTPAGISSQFVTYAYTQVAGPVLSSVTPASGPAAGGTTVTLTGSGLSGTTAVRFGSTVASSFTVVSDTQVTAVAPAGSGTVQITVTTPGGTSNGVAYAYGSVPVVSGVSPNQGPVFGGNTVILTGSNFSGATAVTFGATTATSFTVDSDTRITAVAPPGTGTVQVTVTTPAGISSQFVTYAYTQVAGPVLSSVTPASGPAAGGTTVTLTGSGLSGTTAVRFGSTVASSFTVVSDTQVTAVAPAGSGTVQITVTTPGGTSNGVAYAYGSVPVVSGVSPNQGPVFGGNTVIVTGSNFSGATAVTFGTTTATSFTVDSPTRISAVVPPGAAGAVQITVTGPGGTSAPGATYFYLAAPVLTGVTPASGPLGGGISVTLTGSHFLNATAVRFGAAAASFTVVSDTRITAVAPPSSTTGAVQVTVTTPGGTGGDLTYEYLAAPVLTALSPAVGRVSGGDIVTLTGSGFARTTSVRFGTVTAAFTVVSDTALTAAAPPGPPGPVGVTVTTPGGTSTALTYSRVPPPTI
ncbi:IPT/TIG domain-containing protein [Streptomyces sp. N2A]|uniref:beta strand repeat-containing protein n=1 Tax=Streptomyces sp. N2A TaxID=3073936 RepID=UPI00286FDB1E|nr:IPT/TIG domain-containing protein [Streptomyces sp. N2A]